MNKEGPRYYFSYNFDKESRILYKYHYGVITLDDISSSWDYAIDNNKIPIKTNRFILDYRKASFDIKSDEHLKIVAFYQKHLKLFGNSKIAVVTENFKDIVVPLLIEYERKGYTSKSFSTLDAAIYWVMN